MPGPGGAEAYTDAAKPGAQLLSQAVFRKQGQGRSNCGVLTESSEDQVSSTGDASAIPEYNRGALEMLKSDGKNA